MKSVILIIFLLTYLGVVVFSQKKTPIMALGAASMVLVKFLAGPETAGWFAHLRETVHWTVMSINWNVMGIFWGMLYITGVFIYSKVPVLLADILIDRAKHVGMAILAVCALSSLISAFVENVATVMIVAPIALVICKKLKISPMPFLIGIAISSNLQGTATLIGDPPSMILAGAKQMSFNDFFVYQGKPGIFWAVQLGAIVSFVVLAYLFRAYRQPVEGLARERVLSWTPTAIIVGMILCLAVAPLFDPESEFLGGIICVLFGIGSLIWYYYARGKDRAHANAFWREYADWETIIFLLGIFIVVEGLEDVGLIEDAAHWMTSVVGQNLFLTYTVIVWASVAISALIDNVPYITAMIPLCQAIAINLGIADNVLVFGLLIGACLGGNITPVGAAANVVAVGILKRNGYVIKFSEFVKIGLPFTVAATFASYIFVWLVWA
jgi:Na+/H+ antiporter NhaD/arsenite permease-like protein